MIFLLEKKFSKKLGKIKNYWEDKETISLNDKNLRYLEVETIKKFLKSKDHMLDIGCGNGSETLEFAKKAKHVTGCDNSDYFLKTSRALAKKKRIKNIEFVKTDIMKHNTFPDKTFDAAASIRVLINLPTWELQKQAILNIKKSLKPRGRYMMLECSNQGISQMNDFRLRCGLPKINSPRWNNVFFDEPKLIQFLSRHFKILKTVNFNLYYFLTRVYMQMFATAKGYGKNFKAEPIFKKSDVAARQIYEILSEKTSFLDKKILGQEFCLVLEKK